MTEQFQYGPDRRLAMVWSLVGAAAGLVFYWIIARLVLFGILGDADATGPFQCRVMSHWINMFSITAFTIACGLLLVRWRFVNSELSHFASPAITDDVDKLILQADAAEYRKAFRQMDEPSRFCLLNHLLWIAMQRARANWSSEDVSAAVTVQSELCQATMDAQYSMIRYLAAAIPSIGFVGTVLGIGQAMGALGGGDEKAQSDVINEAAAALGTAFDTTFVALILSLVLMYIIHRVQGDEESLLARAATWCHNNFAMRMHIPQKS